MYQEISQMLKRRLDSDEISIGSEEDHYFLKDLEENENSEYLAEELDLDVLASLTELKLNSPLEGDIPFSSITSETGDTIRKQQELKKESSEIDMEVVIFPNVASSSSPFYKSPATVAQSFSPLINSQRKIPVIKRALLRKDTEVKDRESGGLSPIASEGSFSSLDVGDSPRDIEMGKKRNYYEDNSGFDSDFEEQEAESSLKRLRH